MTFYSIAAGLSLSLTLILLLFAYFQPGTLVIRNWAVGVLVLSIGFFVSGIGTVLPVWATVIASNVALLSAGPILYSGFSSHCNERRAVVDQWGWAVVALTIPAFWQWGLIEPNGHYRSMVFSLATVIINSRTALQLGRAAWQRTSGVPTKAMAVLFAALSIWMMTRFFILLSSDPVSPDLKGANPTSWKTVFGYIVLMSLMSVCVMWMEVNRLRDSQAKGEQRTRSLSGFVEYFRNKLLLLWSGVTVLIVGVVSMLGIGYVNIREVEKTRLVHAAKLANDAFVEHTIQATNHIEVMLNAVRGYYLRSRSLSESSDFIRSLGIDHSLIDNIYIIDSDGRIVLAHEPAATGRSVADRDYFAVHSANADDRMIISPVEFGRVTGKYHFRCSRRIDNLDGGFAGIVLATVNPAAFARYYRDLLVGSQSTAALLSIVDQKLMARVPEPVADRWLLPIDSPVWKALQKVASGHYENTSSVDNIRRLFVYKKVGNLPLVMVTGFSSADLKHGVRERMIWLVGSMLVVLLCVLLLALMLTIEAKRRNEQDRFMSMLSHELKTPLSILRLALGSETMQPGIRNHAQRAVVDMHAVIERCLHADRLEHGRFSLTPESVDIASLLEKLCADCASPEQLTLHVAALPVCTCDPQIVQIILNNLLDNALKYGATDGIVSIEATSADRQGRPGISIRIANDIGTAGIPDANRVFERYYRAAGAHSKTGSGLGLYLSANLARLLDGQLRSIPSASEVSFELWVPT